MCNKSVIGSCRFCNLKLPSHNLLVVQEEQSARSSHRSSLSVHTHTKCGGLWTLWCKHMPHLLSHCSPNACNPHLSLLLCALPLYPSPLSTAKPRTATQLQKCVPRSTPLVDMQLSMATGGRKLWTSTPAFPLPSMLPVRNKDTHTCRSTQNDEKVMEGGFDLPLITLHDALVSHGKKTCLTAWDSALSCDKNVVYNWLSTSAVSSATAPSCNAMSHNMPHIHTHSHPFKHYWWITATFILNIFLNKGM